MTFRGVNDPGSKGTLEGRGLISLYLLLASLLWCVAAFGEVENVISQMSLLDDEQLMRVGDRLTYSVLEERERPQILFVNDRGEVDVPLIGRVPALGKTCRTVSYEIKSLLEVDFYHRATVLIDFPLISNSRGEVVILGEVRTQGPQTIPMDKPLSVSNAILRAGGFLQRADREKVVLMRKDPVNAEEDNRIEIDVAKIFETGRSEEDIMVEPDDLILVPQLREAGGQFYIHGAVKFPRLYTIPNDKDFTVSKAVLMAGGFTKFADKKKVKLIRADLSLEESEKTVIVNVADVLEKGIRTFDLIVQTDDIIKVPERWFNIQ